jgi:hypothetical protein
MRGIDGLVSLLLVMAVSAGCAATRGEYGLMKPDLPTDGFLGEYAQKLQPGDEKQGQAGHFYNDPSLREVFPTYTKVIIDPVMWFRGEEAKTGGVAQEDAQNLVNYMHNKLYLAFKDSGFEIVDTPGPNTVRFKVALSSLQERWVGLDVVSTIVPQLHATGELKGFVTGKPSFVGAAVVQFKASDAKTGKILAAGVDRRVGGKTLSKGFDKWADVINIMDYWGGLVQLRICKMRGRADCPAPKA